MREHLNLREGAFIDNSKVCKSEKCLKQAVVKVCERLQNLLVQKNYQDKYKIIHRSHIDTKKIIPQLKDNHSIRSDGGFIILKDLKTKQEHILCISEDKIQGTNDKNYRENKIPEIAKKRKKLLKIIDEEKIDIDPMTLSNSELLNELKKLSNYPEIKKKYAEIFCQARGNAIERFAKNLNACSIIFEKHDIYPYIIFISGCDFHPSETIYKRLEQGNFYKPNYGVENIDNFSIRLTGRNMSGCCFVKYHHYTDDNVLFWTCEEEERIIYNTCIQTLNYYTEKGLI